MTILILQRLAPFLTVTSTEQIMTDISILQDENVH